MDMIGTRAIISRSEELSISKQCTLLNVSRACYYYDKKKPSKEDLEKESLIKSRLDYWHTKMCYLGVRRLVVKLNYDGITVGRKLVKRYMDEMGIYAIHPKPNTSKPRKNHIVFPYLVKKDEIARSNQVWAIDITYIKMGRSHMYLTAIIDWYSRYIVGYELSNSLDTAPVLNAIKKAIRVYGKPEMINSDQGSQFTSNEYIGFLNQNKIIQSMDGKARWVDNVVIERWFRSLKYDKIYINEYNSPRELRGGIKEYVEEYNQIRPHQSLDYKCPSDVYLKNRKMAA